MTWSSASSYLAVALLGALLTVLGTRFRGLSGRQDSGAFRAVVASLAGTIAFFLALTILDAIGIAWYRFVLVGVLGGAIVAAHYLSRAASAREPLSGEKTRWGWSDGIALFALAAFARYAVSLCIVIPDFIFHWGVKGERFFLANGTDYTYLAMPWNETIQPHYPTLLPDLYAASALLAGGFSANALMLWSVACFGLLLLAGREAVRQAGVQGWVAESTLAITAFAVAAAGMRGNMAGGADWLISLALVVAMPALLRPADRVGSVQIGMAAAFAAASKVEGTVLAVALIFVQCLRSVAGRKSGRRLDFPGLAALLLPAVAVALPWQVEVRRFHFVQSRYYGSFNFGHLHGIGQALRYELTTSPAWHGFAYSLLLLPLLGCARRLRAIVAVVSMQLLFYLYAYFSFLFDPIPLVITSFERFELHLVPTILLAAGIGLDRFARSWVARGAPGESEDGLPPNGTALPGT